MSLLSLLSLRAAKRLNRTRSCRARGMRGFAAGDSPQRGCRYCEVHHNS
jgi:hypothetical protein